MAFKNIIFTATFVLLSLGVSFFLIDKNNSENEDVITKIKENYVSKDKLNELNSKVEKLNEFINDSHLNEGVVIDKTVYNIKRTNVSYEQKVKNLTSSNKVGVSKFKPSKFEFGENILISDSEIPDTKVNNTFCVYDDFSEKYPTYNATHGELVVDLIRNYYKGDIYTINMSKFEYNSSTMLLLSNCDVVNFSFINEVEDQELNDFIYVMLSFLDSRGTIVIASAGNEYGKDSYTINANSKIKKDGFGGNLFIISQAILTNNTPEITQSSGNEIDFVVVNDDMYYNGNPISGTSFAAPVVSSVVANLLDVGVQKNYLFDTLKTDKSFTYDNVNYSIFLIEDAYKNAKKIKEEQ